MNAELAHDVAEPSALPMDGLPEVAVLGRSNVGKSSVINALTGRRGLARTSRTPGKTRRIHFYRLEDKAYLVDLPGFGYARVAKVERRAWKPLVEAYLRGRRRVLRGCILLIDARRGAQTEELELLDWLRVEGIAVRVALTKTDKLKPAELARCLRETRVELALAEEEMAAVSGRTGAGLNAPAGWIQAWTGLSLRRPDGTPF